MKMLLKEYGRAKSAAIVVLFFAALASTSIARGQITFVKSFGGLNFPSGVAVDDPTGQEVYVGDEENYRIQVFNLFNNSSYKYQSSFGTARGGRLTGGGVKNFGCA